MWDIHSCGWLFWKRIGFYSVFHGDSGFTHYEVEVGNSSLIKTYGWGCCAILHRASVPYTWRPGFESGLVNFSTLPHYSLSTTFQSYLSYLITIPLRNYMQKRKKDLLHECRNMDMNSLMSKIGDYWRYFLRIFIFVGMGGYLQQEVRRRRWRRHWSRRRWSSRSTSGEPYLHSR